MDTAPDASGAQDPLTNTLRPTTDATLTVRVIKSLAYRNYKPLVLQHLDLEATTVGQLKDRIRDEVATKPAFKPYRTAAFDTLKIYTHAHGAKVLLSAGIAELTVQTTNLIINLDHDDWVLNDDAASLASVGLVNESEVSFYVAANYDAFKASPDVRW